MLCIPPLRYYNSEVTWDKSIFPDVPMAISYSRLKMDPTSFSMHIRFVPLVCRHVSIQWSKLKSK